MDDGDDDDTDDDDTDDDTDDDHDDDTDDDNDHKNDSYTAAGAAPGASVSCSVFRLPVQLPVSGFRFLASRPVWSGPRRQEPVAISMCVFLGFCHPCSIDFVAIFMSLWIGNSYEK